MKCGVCSHDVEPRGRALVLARHDVQYFHCPTCGFMQTEDPYWLPEAYSDAITSSDLGLVKRNVEYSAVAEIILQKYFGGKGPVLDYGGGYGMLVRMMRDRGYDCYRYEKNCPNLFAKGFDMEDCTGSEYAMVTAFEVMEHLVRPIEHIDRMLARSRNLLFTTQLLPEPPPSLSDWWYYGLEHGQHVAFYSRRTLDVIARRFGLSVYSCRDKLHLLTDRHLSALGFQIVAGIGKRAPWLRPCVTWRRRPPSRLADDFYTRTGWRLPREH